MSLSLVGLPTYSPQLQRDLREIAREIARVGMAATTTGAAATSTVKVLPGQSAAGDLDLQGYSIINVDRVDGLDLQNLTTNYVSEGSRLYYTDARVDARVTAALTPSLAPLIADIATLTTTTGTLTASIAGLTASLATLTTDQVPETATHRYFSNDLVEQSLQQIANIYFAQGVSTPLRVNYTPTTYLELSVGLQDTIPIATVRATGDVDYLDVLPNVRFRGGVNSDSGYYGINTDSYVFSAQDDGSSTNHLAAFLDSGGTPQLVVDHNCEISNFACAASASVTFRAYNTSNANFKFIKSVDSLTTSPLMEWYNDDTTRIAYMQDDGYLYSDSTGIYLTAQNTVTLFNKTISGASNTLSNLNASNLTSGSVPDARIPLTNVSQHQGSLSIAESQIPNDTILARCAGTETISAQWTFSEALKSSKGAALHGNTVSTYIGLDNRRTFAGNFDTYSYGAYNKMQWQPNTMTTNAYAWGTVNQLYLDNGAYAGNVDFLRGGDFSVYVSTAHTVLNQLGGDFLVVNTGTGSVSAMHPFRARAQVNNGSLAVTAMHFVDVYGLEGTVSYASFGTMRGVNINDLKGVGTANAAVYIAAQTTSSNGDKGNLVFAGGDWDDGHLVLGTFHIWWDGTNLWYNDGAPTSGSDGTVWV